MSLKVLDRVKETTTTTGTGSLTLAGAMTGFRSFSSVMAVGDTCFYGLQAVDGSGNPTGAWEVGLGTYSAASTFARTQFLASSTGAILTLAAGTTQVWIDHAGAAIRAYEYLQGLRDVAVGAANLGDVLTYSLAGWANRALRLSPGAAVAPIFVPGTTGTQFTFTNGGHTAVQNSATGHTSIVPGTVPVTGKTYFEITCAGVGSNDFYVGFAPIVGFDFSGGTDITFGAGTPGLCVATDNSYADGVVANSSGTQIVSIGAGYGMGDRYDFCYDSAAGLAWVRKNGNGWNNGAITAQDPANGIGGIPITPTTSQFYPCFGSRFAGNGAKINQGDSSFVGVPPLGFTGTVSNTYVNPSDVSTTAPVDGDTLIYNGALGQYVPGNPVMNADGNRNGFVDGQFDSWGQGASISFTSGGFSYSSDMWLTYAGAGGAATVSRGAYALGQNLANSPIPPTFFLQHVQSTAATDNPTTTQRIEGVRSYAGQSVTVSYCLSSAAALTVPSIKVTQIFGTGGSPSANVVTTKVVTWAVGTTEKRFSVRLDIPSVAGKTLGTNSNDSVQIDLVHPTGATYTIKVGQAQIEPCSPNASGDTTGVGGYPTNYAHRGYAAEAERVLRLYERGIFAWDAGTVSAAGVSVGSNANMTTKRASPVLSSQSAGNAGGIPAINSLGSGSLSGVNAFCTSTAAGGYILSQFIIADARL